MFYFENINKKKILRSDMIQNANAFFTTRESAINENEQLIINYLGVKKLIYPQQTHSGNIQIVEKNKFNYPNTDALILTIPEYAIFLNFADCTPIILYDTKQNIGAICHAGWRGSVKKIAPKTIQKMIEDFNTKPENVTALIGPAISSCCYNVGEEVFEKLKITVKNFNNLYKISDNNFFVDLKSINSQQIRELGVKNIDICPYCTSCDNNYFFSYRKENGTTNRHNAVLKLA
ncbi:peptidoglycan editing factor PgeF [bacterium]|nr:peptidoglycan editing factor PgeF [bacterium]